jgi:hypothetical protein
VKLTRPDQLHAPKSAKGPWLFRSKRALRSCEPDNPFDQAGRLIAELQATTAGGKGYNRSG